MLSLPGLGEPSPSEEANMQETSSPQGHKDMPASVGARVWLGSRLGEGWEVVFLSTCPVLE